MGDALKDTYRGWTLSVAAEKNLCSKFTFDITDPAGRSQHITLGGDSADRAMERAREMIDMEIATEKEEELTSTGGEGTGRGRR